ncbi:MAG: T9SS type A sorting domain-containing protein [Flavobacteriales bacterium]|nr:T9SS type A sorting domain-containing protein [Flavobacteriales bacterium]
MSRFARSFSSAALALTLSGAIAQRVDNAEYFWDTDPGAGNGIGMSAEDGAFDAAFERIFLNTSSLPGLGAHTLGIRVKDQNLNWGAVFSTVIVIEPSIVTAPEIEVSEAEFFWDVDPGEGSGTPMLAFDGDYNSALESIAMETSALPVDGVHVLNVRARDVNDAWSVPFRVIVEVLGGAVTFPEIRVSAAEYFVNIDPGAGNAMPMLAVDGDFGSALEAIKGGGIPAPVDAGVNVLWLRARDANNAWGPSFGIVVNIDTTIAGTVGMDEAATTNDVRLVPNPARMDEGFAILLDQRTSNVRVVVFDAAGRKVMDRAYSNQMRLEVAMPTAAAGVYQVGVYMNGVPRWKRLVVQ